MKNQIMAPLLAIIVVSLFIVLVVILSSLSSRLCVADQTIENLQEQYYTLTLRNSSLENILSAQIEYIKKADSVILINEIKRDSLIVKLHEKNKEINKVLQDLALLPGDSAQQYYLNNVLPDINNRFWHYLQD